MKKLTYNSEDYYLFWPRADDSNRQTVEFHIPSKIHAGQSEREARPPLGASLRVASYRFSTVLSGYEPRDLTDSLKAKTTEKIMVPFWPAAVPQSDYPNGPMDGGLNISFEVDEVGWSDFAVYEIHSGRSPSSGYTVTDKTWTAPILIGNFEREPRPSLETDELQDLSVSFVEDSEVQYSLDLDAQTFDRGPTLGETKYLFPLRHDFSRAARSGGTEINIKRRRIGQGRKSTIEEYGGEAYETLRYNLPFANLNQACQLIRFFEDRKGISENFWLPGHVAEARLRADVSGTDLQVDTPADFASYPYIALCDRTRIVPAKVSSTTANSLTLGESAGDWEMGETSLCKLLLVRFAKTRIRLGWSGGSGEAAIEFKELRPEVSAPTGETVSTTIGAVARECSLYEFTTETGAIFRLTSYERDLTWSGQNWVKHPITHGLVERTIALEDQVNIRAEPVEGSPLLGFRRHEVARLWVKVYRAQASGAVASDARQVFAGEVLDCAERGWQLEARAVLYGVDFDKAPRGRFQSTCWYRLFGGGCELDVADWTFTGHFTAVGNAGFPYDFTLGNFTRDNGQALPSGFGRLNYFAWGSLEIGKRKLSILSSGTIASGAIAVKLDGDPDPFPSVGAMAKLIPSCDGKYTTCGWKFGNRDNWGGHLVPNSNLSLLKVTQAVGGGKK